VVTPDATDAIAGAFTEEWGRIVATLIARTGDWDLAEECAQQAFAEAVRRWPRDGVPRQPGAWLTTVARNRAVDRLRHEQMKEQRLRAATDLMTPNDPPDEPDPPMSEEDESGIADDRLRLMFTCCHPALPLEGRVALTLRTLAGLTTAEIARAFFVSEATMAKRLVRAKGKIAHARIPYRVPPAHMLPERTGGVLAVLYLLFNEGYKASAGADLVRTDLCGEAIRLTRLLDALMPDEPEAAGLLERALRRHSAGPYQLQAAIAACHAQSAHPDATDWARIATLYERLLEVMPQPIVALNHAIAVAMAHGADRGLVLVDELDASGELSGYHLLHATRADLLRRLGRVAEARAAYQQALELTSSDAERRFLARRLEETAPV
jgi:RNA polymerase sigma-70 factor (ECF subfamily)